MHLTIVLIGPYLAGKSTIANSLAIQLGIPQCVLATGAADPYSQERGYDAEVARQLWEEDGFRASERFPRFNPVLPSDPSSSQSSPAGRAG
jgi:shikimate kinase